MAERARAAAKTGRGKESLAHEAASASDSIL